MYSKQETSLRATKYLPSIVKLQRFLYDIHHYRSSEEEAHEKSIGQFLIDISNGKCKNIDKTYPTNIHLTNQDL